MMKRSLAIGLISLTLAALAAPALAADSLVSAVQMKDREAALAMLKKGADVSKPGPDGTTALMWAAYNGDADLVKRLLKAGADPNARNDYGASPLSAAALAANAASVRLLLEAGADPNSPNEDGQTALMVVARAGNVEAAKALIEHGADVNAREQWRKQTALMWAAAKKRPEMVKLLLRHGAEPDVRSDINNWERQVSGEPRAQYREAGGLTPLLFAAREGCVDCARNLVDGGADINMSDPENVTPLIMAINNYHFDLAKYLIEAGANLDKWDWWGRTPLYVAVDVNTLPQGGREERPSLDKTTSTDIIRLLLEKGADPDAQLKLFPPYRHVGADRGCDLVLNIGSTPLLRAAKTFDAAAIKLLVAHGADVNRPNVDGVTPVMVAAGSHSVECDVRGGPSYILPGVQEKSIAALTLLLDAGADVNHQDSLPRGQYSTYREQTALHGAAFWGWNKVARFLIDHGARIDIQDKNGMTPVDSAMGRAGGHGRGQVIEVHEETADLLRKACAAQPDCHLPERKDGDKTALAE